MIWDMQYGETLQLYQLKYSFKLYAPQQAHIVDVTSDQQRYSYDVVLIFWSYRDYS